MKTAYTAFETIGNVDLRQLADDELNSIINNLQVEQQKRQYKQKENDWLELTSHLYKYIEKYGGITIRSDWEYTAVKTLGLDSDCSTFGEITL